MSNVLKKHGLWFEYGGKNPDESSPSPLAMIYRSELDYVSRCILDYPDIETGGQLFGFWTSTGIPVVLYAIGPGRNANHQETFFNQDLDYLVMVGNFLLEKYGLQHIGEWHSHHQLGLARPSGHDDSTMVNNICRSHLRRFLLCIGNCQVKRGVALGNGGSGYAELRTTFNAFNFHEDHGYDYEMARWSIKECESPFRQLVDQDLQDVLIHPESPKPCHGEVYKVETPKDRVVSEFEDGYWLNSAQNKKVLVEINKFLKETSYPQKVSVMLDENHHVHMTAGKVALYFPAEFPKVPVSVSIDGVTAGGEVQWNFQGDILEAFTQYYAAVTRNRQLEKEDESCLQN